MQWTEEMVHTMADLFGQYLAVLPSHIYEKHWNASLSAFIGYCPMRITKSVIPLMEWECAHLGVHIERSHVQVHLQAF